MSSEGLFNVYIERARAATPDAAAQLAHAIAEHYGIDATSIRERLSTGRFRVKGNVDRATADSFASDLTKLGAVVKVERAEEATPPPAAQPVAPSPAAVAAGKAKRNRTPPTGVKIPSLGGTQKPTPAPVPSPVSLQQPRVAAPPKPVAPTPAPAPPAPAPAAAAARASQPQFTSGLAAAASANPAEQDDLGALTGDIPLTLSTLDGADDNELSASRSVGLSASFGPPAPARKPAASSSDDVDVSMDDDVDVPVEAEPFDASMLPASMGSSAMPASIGPATAVRDLGSMAPAGRDLGGATDMFAPPEAAADEVALTLDDGHVRKKPGAMAPPVLAEAPPSGTHAATAPARVSAPQPVVRAPGEPAWKTYGKDERVRFVAGVFVAALVGGIPAMVTAAVRERSAFADIDSQLQRQESTVLTRGDWDALDRVRASFVERKRAERQSIALTTLVLWAAISGGAAFLWFRKIDWDRIFGG